MHCVSILLEHLASLELTCNELKANVDQQFDICHIYCDCHFHVYFWMQTSDTFNDPSSDAM